MKRRLPLPRKQSGGAEGAADDSIRPHRAEQVVVTKRDPARQAASRRPRIHGQTGWECGPRRDIAPGLWRWEGSAAAPASPECPQRRRSSRGRDRWISRGYLRGFRSRAPRRNDREGIVYLRGFDVIGRAVVQQPRRPAAQAIAGRQRLPKRLPSVSERRRITDGQQGDRGAGGRRR